MRVDVPDEEDGKYRTELYSISAIYSVKFVSEEIARAYAPRKRDITAYNSPIVSREQHEAAVREYQLERNELYSKITELERRLTMVNTSLGSGKGPADGAEKDIPF